MNVCKKIWVGACVCVFCGHVCMCVCVCFHSGKGEGPCLHYIFHLLFFPLSLFLAFSTSLSLTRTLSLTHTHSLSLTSSHFIRFGNGICNWQPKNRSIPMIPILFSFSSVDMSNSIFYPPIYFWRMRESESKDSGSSSSSSGSSWRDWKKEQAKMISTPQGISVLSTRTSFDTGFLSGTPPY